MKKLILALSFLSLLATSVQAQWQVPLNSIPVGRGPGVQGFTTVLGSGGSGANCLRDTSPPTFGSCSGGVTDVIVGSTPIVSGTTSRILYDNAGILGEYTLTGTGTVVAMANSPTIITPAITGSTRITGSATAVSPALNASSYLELINTDIGTFNGGTQLRFGIVPGSPFAMLSSGVRSGPSPYEGQLVFAIKPAATSALRNVLWLTQTGSLQSTDDPNTGHDYGPRASFGAYNQYGAQAFAGFSQTNAGSLDTTAGGYFVGYNNTGAPGVSNAWGIYSDCQAFNNGFCWAAELSVGNQSGVDSTIPDPNNLFGIGVGPTIYNIVSQPQGIGELSSVNDVSAWAMVAGGPSTSVYFKKGLVFLNNSIKSIGGHTEAINLSTGYEIAWYNLAGTNIGRLKSDGVSPFWNGVALASTVSPTISTPTFTGNITPTYTGGTTMLAKSTNTNSVESWQIGINVPTDAIAASRASIYFNTTVGTGGSDSNIQFWTDHYGVSASARMTIDRDGNVSSVGTNSATGGFIAGGNTGITTTCTIAVGQVLTFTLGIITAKGGTAGCT